MPQFTKSIARHPLGLLFLAILLWGVNWPIMKIGLDYITPLWFTFYRLFFGTISLFIILTLTEGTSAPRRQDWPVLFSVGVLQIGLSMGLIHLGLQYVEPGRSAILTYTMPIWIAPLAFVFLREKLTSMKLIGLLVGIAGIAVLFNPLTFPWGNQAYLYGNSLLLVAAFLWAIAIVHVRGHNWSGSTMALLPWQMLIGTITLLPFMLTMEGIQPFPHTWELGLILLYNGPIATALGFYVFISATRMLPANTTGMTALGVPVVGMLASALVVGEVVTLPKMLGLGLICGGILLAGRKSSK